MPVWICNGAKNQFILLDCRDAKNLTDAAAPKIAAGDICQKLHQKWNYDQLIVLTTTTLPSSHQPIVQVAFWNNDGSTVTACGNGSRVVGDMLLRGTSLTGHPPTEEKKGADGASTTFVTKAGRLLFAQLLAVPTDPSTTSVTTTAADAARPLLVKQEVFVAMGGPNFQGESIPLSLPFANDPTAIKVEDLLPVELLPEWKDRFFPLATSLSMGNPHLVTFLRSESDFINLQLLMDRVGRHIQSRKDVFPANVNVGFAYIFGSCADDEPQTAQRMALAVCEGGAGMTLACGTGACAAAIAAKLNGFLPISSSGPVQVHMPGGTLFVGVSVKEGEGSQLLSSMSEVLQASQRSNAITKDSATASTEKLPQLVKLQEAISVTIGGPVEWEEDISAAFEADAQLSEYLQAMQYHASH